MTDSYAVGNYLVDRLAGLGLKHLFSIAGDYSIDWVNRYVEPSAVEVIEEVNELNAGYAADAYARFTGIGALCVTYSAGALCAVNAIAGAYVEKAAIVLINGTPSWKKTITFDQTGFMAHHFISGHETDLQVFEHMTVAAVRVDNPDTAPFLIDYALTQCITHRRPIYIELLEDIVDLPCRRPEGDLKAARIMDSAPDLQESVNRVKQALERASKPVLWIGPEVDRFGLHDKTAALIRQLKIPYVTSLLSKAVFSEDDAQFAGVFDGQASSKYVKDRVDESDFVLALGVWLTDITVLGWEIDFEKTAFVALDAAKFGTYFGAQVSLEHLIDGLLSSGVNCKSWDLPAREQKTSRDVAAGDKITYQAFYDVVSDYIDDNTIIGSDPSLNYFGSMLLKVGKARGYVAQPSYSAIGYIGAAATGICLANPDTARVMVFSGDGGFQMTAQCLSTQTRFKLSPIIFVIDNGIYGVEQWLADASVFHSEGKKFYKSCILHPWNYSKLADVFGCKGWSVETCGELRAAITEAVANSGCPSIIQVRVPGGTIPDNAAWKSQ